MAYWALFTSRKRPQKALNQYCSGRGDSIGSWLDGPGGGSAAAAAERGVC
jgi:hypothetical protein